MSILLEVLTTKAIARPAHVLFPLASPAQGGNGEKETSPPCLFASRERVRAHIQSPNILKKLHKETVSILVVHYYTRGDVLEETEADTTWQPSSWGQLIAHNQQSRSYGGQSRD